MERGVEGATFIYQTKRQKSRTLGSEQRRKNEVQRPAEPVSEQGTFPGGGRHGDVAVEGSAGSRVCSSEVAARELGCEVSLSPRSRVWGVSLPWESAYRDVSAEFRAIALASLGRRRMPAPPLQLRLSPLSTAALLRGFEPLLHSTSSASE